MQKPEQIFKNRNLNSASVKNRILRYLYRSNINLDTKHEHIVSEKDLDTIRDKEYIVCPRYSGVRSWIMFFRDNTNYYAVNFPKHNQHRKDILQIHPVDIVVSSDLYLGTVMEGIYYRDESSRYLAVDEVYTLGGVSQLLRKKTDRLNSLANFFKTNLKANPQYVMYVGQHYAINPMNLSQLHEKIKDENRIQDIIFYPQIYGGVIHSYTIIETDRADDIIKLSEFYMEKTVNPDVYKLLSIDSRTKVDLAYIPDIGTSRMCRDWFVAPRSKAKAKGAKKRAQKITELRVRCREDIEKRKWIPIELVEEDLDSDLDSDSE